jgi:ATP-binding cassette subfamily F protein 3
VEKMKREMPEAGPTAPKAFRLSFHAGTGTGIVRLEGVSKSYGTRHLFSDVDFELGKGDKVGLVGPNGAGKTTLLEILIGRQDADSGSVFRGKNLNIGYFAQEAEELDFDRTLLEEIKSIRNPPPPEGWARGLLGRFWFSGDTVNSKVGQLSGGSLIHLAQSCGIAVVSEPTTRLLHGQKWGF